MQIHIGFIKRNCCLNQIFRIFLLALSASVPAVPLSAQSSPSPDAHAWVFTLIWGPGDGPQRPAPPHLRPAMDRFLARWKAFREAPPPPGRPSELHMLHARRQQYQRVLYSIAASPKADEQAKDYVRRLNPPYEWEGFPDSPEREARFAESYLAAEPDSPFRHYLPLLAAHCWLCAAEAYDFQGGRDGEQKAASSREAYKRNLAAAQVSAEPLIRAAAQALEAIGRCYPPAP